MFMEVFDFIMKELAICTIIVMVIIVSVLFIWICSAAFTVIKYEIQSHTLLKQIKEKQEKCDLVRKAEDKNLCKSIKKGCNPNKCKDCPFEWVSEYNKGLYEGRWR